MFMGVCIFRLGVVLLFIFFILFYMSSLIDYQQSNVLACNRRDMEPIEEDSKDGDRERAIGQ